MVYCPRAGWQFLISEGNRKLLSFFLDVKAVRKKKASAFCPPSFLCEFVVMSLSVSVQEIILQQLNF